jgi:uncharacterized protein involved in exopolysaccharide biosynthesis
MPVEAFPVASSAESRFAPVLEVLSLARRRAWLILASIAVTLCAAVIYLVFAVPSYRATIEIYIDPQTLQIVGRGLTRSDTAASIEFAGIDSQVLVLTSASLLNAVIDDLDLRNDPVLAAGSVSEATRGTTVLEALRQRIVVRRVDASLVFQVTVSHPVAEQAARIANAIGAAYFKLGSQDRGNAVGKASASLSGQSSQLRGELAKAEGAVESFKVKTGLISTGEAGLLVSQQLKDLYTQISVAEGNLPRLAARRNELRKLSAAQLAATDNGATPEAIVSPVIGALRTQYASIIQSEAQLARTLGERHPDLANVREQKRAVLEQIQNELGRIARATDEDYRRAQESLAGLKKQADTLVNSQIASDEAKIKLRQLESEARAIRTVYDESTARVKELQQQQQIETNNSRIISDAAIPLRPMGTPKALVLLAGALFGIVLGFALAYLLDWLEGARAKPVVVAAAPPSRIPVVASLRPVSADGVRPSDDSRLLIEVAKKLRSTFGQHLPATIIVTGGELNDNGRIADDLAEVLVWCGDAVLRCHGGIGKNALSTELLMRPGDMEVRMKTALDGPQYVVVDASVDRMAADPALAAEGATVLLVVQPEHRTGPQFDRILDLVDRGQVRRNAGQIGLIRLRPDDGAASLPQPQPAYAQQAA